MLFRSVDPLKRWKLSPIDLTARLKYGQYGKARDAMLKATHRKFAPWSIVEFNDQRAGRLNLIRHLLDQVDDYALPEASVELARLKRKPAKERYTGPVKPIRGRY